MSSRESDAPITLGEALRRAEAFLAGRGVASPRLDAELLLAHALGLTRLQLYLDFEKPLRDDERERSRTLLARRAKREPVAWIIGQREFFSLGFEVTPEVLVPRPETELLVEAVLDLDRAGLLPPGPLLDIGTGSGAIAVALAHEMPQREVTATDISPKALEVARRNAVRHGVERRVEFIEGDLAADLIGPFAAIVSNPPYVAEGDRASLAPEVLREPAVALFAGADGLDVIRRIGAMAPKRLMPGGWLLLEVGQGQAAFVSAHLRMGAAFEEIRALKDLAGTDRAVAARRR